MSIPKSTPKLRRKANGSLELEGGCGTSLVLSASSLRRCQRMAGLYMCCSSWLGWQYSSKCWSPLHSNVLVRSRMAAFKALYGLRSRSELRMLTNSAAISRGKMPTTWQYLLSWAVIPVSSDWESTWRNHTSGFAVQKIGRCIVAYS